MFSKKELLIFFYSWIQTFKRSFVIFIKYFWWLIAAEAFLKINLFSVQNYQTVFMGIITILSMISMYFSVLAIRASIEVKDLSYFVSRSKKILGFVLIFVPLFILLNSVIFFNTGISSYNWALSTNLSGLNLIFQSISALILLISAMFLLDTKPAIDMIQSTKNTYLAIINYFPAIIALIVLYISSYLTLTFVLSFINLSLNVASILLLNFFFTCAVQVLYLKIKHKNHKLFFS